MFAAFDRKIAETRSKLTKIERELAPIDALHAQRNQTAQQLADLEAQRAAREAQVAQLQAELSDANSRIERLEALAADRVVGDRYLVTLQELCEHGVVGGDRRAVGAARGASAMAADAETYQRAKQKQITQQIKELAG